jgi:hypothetical protein
MGDDILEDELVTASEAVISLKELLSDYEHKKPHVVLPHEYGTVPSWEMNPFHDLGDQVEEKPNTVTTIDADVLALVLYWNSINLTSPKGHDGSKFMYWCGILRSMSQLYSSDDYDIVMAEEHLEDVPITPTKENYAKATEILDYYKLKLSHRALMGDEPFSEYENKLAGFINSPVESFDLDSLGVIVRLETTYDVDEILDGFMDKYISLPMTLTTSFGESIWGAKKSSYETRTLKFVKKVNVLGNKENNIRYYFEKEDDHSLYCIKLGEKNTLLNVLDYVLESKNNTLDITSSVSSTIMYANSDFWYHTINDGFTIE